MDMRDIRWVDAKGIQRGAEVSISAIKGKGEGGVSIVFRGKAAEKLHTEHDRVLISYPTEGYIFFNPDENGRKITFKEKRKNNGYLQMDNEGFLELCKKQNLIGDFSLQYEEESGFFYVKHEDKKKFWA